LFTTDSVGRKLVVDRAFFGVPQNYSGLSEGAQVVELTPTQETTSLFQSELAVGKRQRFTLFVFGNRSNAGLTEVLTEDVAPVDADESMALVRFVDGLVGASSVRFNLIDGTSIAGPVSFGSVGDYVAVPAGDLEIVSRRVADNFVVDKSRVSFSAGRRYTAVLSGQTTILSVLSVSEDS
jgi:hypothetical protein